MVKTNKSNLEKEKKINAQETYSIEAKGDYPRGTTSPELKLDVVKSSDEESGDLKFYG